MSLRSLEAVTLCLLTRFATFSKSFQVRTLGPKLAPLKMPHSTSTIIAKPYPLYPPVTRILVGFFSITNNDNCVQVKKIQMMSTTYYSPLNLLKEEDLRRPRGCLFPSNRNNTWWLHGVHTDSHNNVLTSSILNVQNNTIIITFPSLSIAQPFGMDSPFLSCSSICAEGISEGYTKNFNNGSCLYRSKLYKKHLPFQVLHLWWPYLAQNCRRL